LKAILFVESTIRSISYTVSRAMAKCRYYQLT